MEGHIKKITAVKDQLERLKMEERLSNSTVDIYHVRLTGKFLGFSNKLKNSSIGPLLSEEQTKTTTAVKENGTKMTK